MNHYSLFKSHGLRSSITCSDLITLKHILFLSSELPGWPLLSPLKVQMQKCEKCAREFCSVINYRRHIRVHHRLKKLDKVFLFYSQMLSLFTSMKITSSFVFGAMCLPIIKLNCDFAF